MKAETPTAVLCTNCTKRPGTINWVQGGLLDFVHGHYTVLCEVCAITKQIVYAQERAAAIPELLAKLADLTAEDE